MLGDVKERCAVESPVQRTFGDFRQALECVAPGAAVDLTLEDRFENIIPADRRRQVWESLQGARWKLPDLRRPAWVVVLCGLAISCIVALLMLAMRTWTALLPLIGLSRAARMLTTPLAVKPPVACETVEEAVLHLTPFRREDYQAGLWSREELAAKIRLVLSEATGVPFARIREDTKLVDLLDC